MRFASVVTFAALIAAAPAVRAGDRDCATDCPTSRDLGGFTFIASPQVRDPFNSTFAGLTANYGYASISPAQISVLGMTFSTKQAHAAEVGGTLSAGVRATSWLSFRLDLSNIVFSGTDGNSALVVGATAQFLGDLGFTLSTQLGSHVRIGFLGTVSNTPTLVVQPLASLVSAVQSRQISELNLLSTTREWIYTAGVAAAVGLGPVVGLDATLDFVHPRAETGGTVDNSNHMAAALLAEFDLAKVTPAPIAFTASYSAGNIFQSGSNTLIQDVVAGLYYSGRRALNLGLNVDGRFFNVRPHLSTDAVIVSIQLQYYWQ